MGDLCGFDCNILQALPRAPRSAASSPTLGSTCWASIRLTFHRGTPLSRARSYWVRSVIFRKIFKSVIMVLQPHHKVCTTVKRSEGLIRRTPMSSRTALAYPPSVGFDVAVRACFRGPTKRAVLVLTRRSASSGATWRCCVQSGFTPRLSNAATSDLLKKHNLIREVPPIWRTVLLSLLRDSSTHVESKGRGTPS